MVLNSSIEAKLKELIKFLKGKKIAVAFSGGVDSSLLAFLAEQHAKETIAITINSPLITEDELEQAKHFAFKHHITQMILKYDPLSDPYFKKNSPNRCYYCKKGLFENLQEITNQKQFDLIVDGSNADDLKDYRPGIKALDELDVISPFIKFNINKSEIRHIAKHFDLEIHSKPSMACIASRFSYGVLLTKEKLERVAKAEEYLKHNYNLSQFRVRCHQDGLARIEILKEELPQFLDENAWLSINRALKELGFCYITIDLEGFRSGSMNECIEEQ